ncbi:MAG: LacI family DNA-binding transcriptional regulator [Ancalomicrobiaceae bacterium]|nr:LacI family DNA-binding transcriptional regulator [Ancalomicrobiaceae bacterium]
MEQFAAYVGLSRPTVSKYFNDPDSVRPKTRNVIEVALKESGFQPNIFAVNLNRRRANILGIVMPNAIDPFYAELTRRIETIAEAAGYLCFSLSSDGKPELEDRAVETLRSLNVAGAVIAPLGMRSHHSTLATLGRSIPLVYADSPLDSTSSFVGTNNAQSFDLIVDYLCRSGDDPCFFDMPTVNYNAFQRRDAYIATMRRLGRTPQVVTTADVDTWEFELFGYEETQRVLQRGGFPTKTILCANDRLAFGVIAALYEAGLRVGRGEGCDFRVAGHDDAPLSRYACPPLTTVTQNIREIGRVAIDLLFRKIDALDNGVPADADNDRVLLNAELMLRASA